VRAWDQDHTTKPYDPPHSDRLATSGGRMADPESDGFRLQYRAAMSGELIIRAVSGEELLSTAAPLRAYAFQPSPRKPDEEELRRRLPYGVDNRVLVAFDGDRPVATATSLPMTQSVRGTVFPAAAIAGVAVDPAARRRGLGRRLVGQLLAEGREQGQVVTALYPFRESFYGRLGYVSAPQLRVARLNPSALLPLLPLDLGGSVERVTLLDSLPDYRALLAGLQTTTHGLMLRGETAAGGAAEINEWVAIARDATGTVVGALQYEIKAWRGELHVLAFVTRTVPARYQLLQWLAHHADQVSTAVLMLPPDTLVENWLPDLEVTTATRTDFVTPMNRVLDVRALRGVPCGPGPEIAIRLTDPFCPWNEGTFTLADDAGTLAIEPTTAEPAATLSIQALTALLYGGHDPAEFPFLGWGTPDEPTCARLRALFPPPANLPYLYEEF
jgi:predicted acetyltransferase